VILKFVGFYGLPSVEVANLLTVIWKVDVDALLFLVSKERTAP
jgi:hypothetical protein